MESLDGYLENDKGQCIMMQFVWCIYPMLWGQLYCQPMVQEHTLITNPLSIYGICLYVYIFHVILNAFCNVCCLICCGQSFWHLYSGKPFRPITSEKTDGSRNVEPNKGSLPGYKLKSELHMAYRKMFIEIQDKSQWQFGTSESCLTSWGSL